MRNVLLAAVSAVALLGSTPDAQAVAAAKEFALLLNGNNTNFAPHTHSDGTALWSTPYGSYWVVATTSPIEGVKEWKKETVDGDVVYLYGVNKDPTHAQYGLWNLPFADWVRYEYFVAPKELDVVLVEVK